MGVDVSSIPFGGVSALLILVFLVQTVRESLDLEGKYIPVAAIAVAIPMMIFAAVAPENVVNAVALGLALAATASFTVRYVKNGEQNEPTTRSTTARVQGNDPAPTRVSSAEWAAVSKS